ncbi:MAG: hypothetical protein F4Z04_07310 [Acidobacteria bacterium]|nr:hypothetical protein [Acidobacteriota bacterium]
MQERMPDRCIAGLRPAVVTFALAAFAAGFITFPAAAQEAAESWETPRLPDGTPDLSGVWVSDSGTPLERPAYVADRDQWTAEEVATLQERADRIFDNGRSAFATADGAFRAAVQDVDTYEAWSTSSSIGMIGFVFDERTSLVIDPPDGRIPPRRPDGAARLAEVDRGWNEKLGPEDLSNNHRCITTGVPRLGGNFGAGPYSYYQIFQTPDHVVFLMEAFHDARIIPIDGRPHVPESVRQWNGDSRGRWEGDTLVVETTNFSPKSEYQGAAEGLHLVERFTRVAADTLMYHVTLADPTTWETPWTAELPLHDRGGDEALFEFACHEGNVSIVGMLRTARLAEEAAR